MMRMTQSSLRLSSSNSTQNSLRFKPLDTQWNYRGKSPGTEQDGLLMH